MMTVRIDGRGSTYDVYFPDRRACTPTSGPKEGDLPQSRSHFRAIVGGLAVGRRLDWFTERAAWEPFQNYSGVTNLLTTELTWRHGPIRVLITDFVAMGDSLPRNAGQREVARASTSSGSGSPTKGPSSARPCSPSTSRPRSTAASATSG